MLWEKSPGKSAADLAGTNCRMPTLYPETLEKKIQASEYFAKSPVAVLVEDMFIQEIMESAQYCLERNKPSRVQLLLQKRS